MTADHINLAAAPNWQPLTNYSGYNHVPEAGAVWFHPNGNAYCCACEKDAQKNQDLSVYRKLAGEQIWTCIARYNGKVDSENQVTMGGAAIDPLTGSLLVVTSLIIPGAPQVTTEKFQGCWLETLGVDDPWTIGGGGVSYIPAPNESVRVFVRNNTPYDGDTVIDLAPFGMGGAVLLNVRLAINGAMGRRLRVGPVIADPHQQDAALITVTVSDPQQRAYESGLVNMRPDGRLLIRSDAGMLSSVFVDVTGWFR